MAEVQKVKENFDKRNFPTQTRILLEKGGQPQVARKAGKLVDEFWRYIIKPEIKPQATTKISSMYGGSKKKSGAQLLEKAESKFEEPKELELEVPIHEPVTTNTGKRVYHRDAKGRFARHAFHSAISEISQPQKGDLGMPQPPKEYDENYEDEPFPEDEDEEEEEKNYPIALNEEKNYPIALNKEKKEALEEKKKFPPLPPYPYPKIIETGSINPAPRPKAKVTVIPGRREPKRPTPPPKPKKEKEELYSPPAEEFESFAGNKKKQISGKEAARREALSKRMKERGTKREKEAEEKFINRMKK